MSLISNPYPLTTYPWARAQRQVLQEGMAPALWYGMWAVPFIAGAWLLLCALAPDAGLVFGEITPAIVVGLCVTVFVLLVRKRNAQVTKAFNASAYRAGNWQVSIENDGLHLNSENVRQIIVWEAVTEVRDGPDGLLIMLGTAVFMPVPAAAFDDEAKLAAFGAALTERIAAKGAE